MLNVHGALDMLKRYGASLADHQAWLLPCFGLAVLLAFSVVPDRYQRRLHVGTTVLAVAAGLGRAWQLRWLCDDAFISFRYAERLVRGEGLVFNVGERVEGYTNFLWTMLLAGAAKLGANIAQTSVVIGIACYVALIVLTGRTARADTTSDRSLALPLAVLLCGAQYSLASFATSGLETMFGALLALAALERALHQRWASSGLLGVLAAITHPDHGILYAALGVAIVTHAPSRRGILRYAIPFVAVYVPYFIWRYQYYGDLFPNTYYAKSGNESYFTQGAAYLSAFFLSSGLWAAAPLAVYGAVRTRGTLFGRYVLIAVPLFCLYVAKIGGDFMHGRLLCVVVPPLLLVIEAGARHLAQRERRAMLALALAATTLALVPTNVFGEREKKWQLADERTFYPLTSFSPIVVGVSYFEWAEDLLKFWKPYEGSPTVGFGCAGILGYYTGFPLVDGFGLTDRAVAHKKIRRRGRPGHEKNASPAYYVSRGVDISDLQVYPAPYGELTHLRLDRTHLYLVHYDPKVIAPLRNNPKATFVDFEAHLGKRQRKGAAPSSEVAACDAWFAQEYFFSKAPDSPYRAKSLNRLLDAGVPAHPPELTQTLNLGHFERTHQPEPSTEINFDQDQRGRYTVTGDAFATFPMSGEVLGQDTILGHAGGMVNTYTEGGLDRAVGRLVTQPFPLVGDVMELWTGGGAPSEHLRVSLIIDGTRQFSSAGCGTEMMGRRLWQIAAFKGRKAVLEVVDESREAWGHLSVDSVVQWVPRPPSGVVAKAR